MKYWILLVNIIIINDSYAQFEISFNDVCLKSYKTESFIKTIKKVTINNLDTQEIRISSVENGIIKKVVVVGQAEWTNFFELNSMKLLNIKGFNYKAGRKERYDICCNYDSFGRLKNNLTNYIYSKDSIRTFNEQYYYLKGKDSILHIGSFYSDIISIEKIDGSTTIRTNSDTIGNVQEIEKFIGGKKIFHIFIKNGKESLGEYYFYNEHGFLKSMIYEVLDEMNILTVEDYVEYYYDNNDRLIQKKKYYEDSQLYSTQTISYNERGLVEKEIEEHKDGKKSRVSLYSYEYW